MAAGWPGDAGAVSVLLDDKYCLVINLVFFSSLEQIVVFPHSEFKQSIADVFRGQQAVFAQHCFKSGAVLGIAAIVHPIGGRCEYLCAIRANFESPRTCSVAM
jgi:hypothetical protein